ncbi:dolichyl-diphosphooligosaccharide--protein glycosyltransferase subunit STT3 [Methanobacterium alcaliphilum]|uniref:dolichyl-diphosphooligosaccharide--protein glycosyltransferase subunit STT3 n=1 Tax=Methanobacterium alcaliphilum TaxID=392018 RepID=UPI00200B0FFB|nr:dolichyl-diphosphooligosaccharide--protein glycosyltransferase subunit STT3 [Methanobacterium alcaliphilum]MCK9151286.1 dolichyl-diphosphooligosaccharide--protein glycosyltransferase subunit STT3 [Methanobacterium alcaliphilum]
MDKNQILVIVILSLFIFTIGFVLRAESINLPAIKENKEFYLDSHGLPYMYELDSYYHYRITENYLKNGHLGDSIKYNQSWDSYSYFPPGRAAIYPPLIVWVAIIFNWIVNIFANISLLESCFWLPALISPLAGIAGYLLVRKYVGDVAGFSTGILLVTAPVYFMRTVPGFFDTDMFNILLPLLTVYFFLEAIDSSKKNYIYFYTAMASVSLTFFALAWTGWSYLLYIMLGAGFIYSMLCKIKKIPVKNFFMIFISFLAISIILVYLISGLDTIMSAIDYPLSMVHLLQSSDYGQWPNIYASVGELRKPTFNEFISGAGPVNLGLGIFGIFVIASVMLRRDMRKKYLPDFNWFLFILIFVWMSIALFAYSTSIRFAMLVIPPLAIFSGVMFGVVIGYIKNASFKDHRQKISSLMIVILLLTICIPPIVNTVDSYTIFYPGVNDDLVNASFWIKSHTNNDTVIFTYWSYGHFFSEFSNRPVSVDGGSQNTPRTFWIYKAFSTSNKTLAKGIFRMLATSGDESYLTLNNFTKNTSLTVKIMEDILVASRDDAEYILINKYNIPFNASQIILNETHPSKSRSFVVITSDEMMYKGYWTFEFGEWNFEKGQGNNYTYSTGITNDTGNIRNYSNGVLVDMNLKKVTWDGKIPYCAIFIGNNTTKTIYMDNQSNFCTLFLLNEKKVVVMDKKFEKSLFTQLVLIKKPTSNFKQLYKNNSVMVWKMK